MATLEMQTMPDGRVTIPVQFEGHDYRLLVDTGGYINTVVATGREAGRLSAASQPPVTCAGMGTSAAEQHYVTVKDFAIGQSHGKNFMFYVDDYSTIYFVDGTLAPQILAAYDVDLDFAHGKLNLISPDHCPGAGGLLDKRRAAAVFPSRSRDLTHIRIPVTIDGKEIMATVDTGAHTPSSPCGPPSGIWDWTRRIRR